MQCATTLAQMPMVSSFSHVPRPPFSVCVIPLIEPLTMNVVNPSLKANHQVLIISSMMYRKPSHPNSTIYLCFKQCYSQNLYLTHENIAKPCSYTKGWPCFSYHCRPKGLSLYKLQTSYKHYVSTKIYNFIFRFELHLTWNLFSSSLVFPNGRLGGVLLL